MSAFADHFSSIAATYAAYRPTYPPALVALLVEHAPQGTVWEVGCGSGQLSVALAEHFPQVIATDPSADQLAAATAHPHVEYRIARAEASGLPDASVSLVVAAQSAHWFDWPAFVAEAERVTAPGALVALISYGPIDIEGDPLSDGIVQRYAYSDVGPYWPPARVHVENRYRDLVLPWTTIEAPEIAMTASWLRDELVGYISSWSATARMVKAQGDGVLRTFAAELATHWPDGERRTVRWPLTIRLSRR